MPRPNNFPLTRDVAGNFRIHYGLRNPFCGRGGLAPNVWDGSRHGVANDTVIGEYENALSLAYRTLSDPSMGWPPLRQLPVRVLVYELELGSCGFAMPDIDDTSCYLALANESVEPDIATARQCREATAVHELTHLFQFRAFPPSPPARWLWFDEASATAVEMSLFSKNRDYYRYLLAWITGPHLSADSTPGYHSAPFVEYLMKRWGTDLISEVYAMGQQSGGTIEAVDALAQTVQLRSGPALPFSSAIADNDIFGYGYCVDAYFLGNPGSGIGNPDILARYGGRPVTETFCTYPVVDATASDAIDHLGCRYYRFRPMEKKRALHVRVDLPDPDAQTSLRGELILVTPQGMPAGRDTLARNPSGVYMEATLSGFTQRAVDHAVLVLANCAYGSGAPDGITFRISAEVS